jgi:hypothetical protein
VLTACDGANSGELDSLLAVLRRFEAEALREEARVLALDLRCQEPPQTGIVVALPSPALNYSDAPIIDLEALEAEILKAA